MEPALGEYGWEQAWRARGRVGTGNTRGPRTHTLATLPTIFSVGIAVDAQSRLESSSENVCAPQHVIIVEN
jgi:hypothetical protein